MSFFIFLNKTISTHFQVNNFFLSSVCVKYVVKLVFVESRLKSYLFFADEFSFDNFI